MSLIIDHSPEELHKEIDNVSWPDGFFSPKLDDKDIILLRESSKEIERSIYTHRHNRESY